MPSHVIERIAFCLAKENASSFIETSLPIIEPVFNNLLSITEKITRDSHNKALHSIFKSNPREHFLQELTWKVKLLSITSAILPDCVVIVVTNDNKVTPFMLTGKRGYPSCPSADFS